MVSVGVPRTRVLGAASPLRLRTRVRGTLTMFGPAFVAAIAYVDPGNFSTNFSAGSRYGYSLLWVVVLASAMAMPIQYMSAKIGIATGRSLPEICRERCPRATAVLLWIQAELVAIATDLAEFVGGAIGLNLVFGVSPVASGCIVGLAAFVLLFLHSHGARTFERAIAFLLIVIVGGFLYQFLHIGIAPSHAATGLLPTVPDSGALYLAAGIVGATMMPHVVYLHSSMTSRRHVHPDDGSRRTALRGERSDVVVALGLAGLVNIAMLLLAARVFAGSSGTADLTAVHSQLGRVAGGGAAFAFAGALLVSGVSSSGVGTLAGQTVMAEFVHAQLPVYVRRGLTMLPAMAVLWLGVNTTSVLNFSQVVLSFGIPFALVPLVLIGRSKSIMGTFVNSRATTALMVVISTLVAGLNLALLVGRFA